MVDEPLTPQQVADAFERGDPKDRPALSDRQQQERDWNREVSFHTQHFNELDTLAAVFENLPFAKLEPAVALGFVEGALAEVEAVLGRDRFTVEGTTPYSWRDTLQNEEVADLLSLARKALAGVDPEHRGRLRNALLTASTLAVKAGSIGCLRPAFACLQDLRMPEAEAAALIDAVNLGSARAAGRFGSRYEASYLGDEIPALHWLVAQVCAQDVDQAGVANRFKLLSQVTNAFFRHAPVLLNEKFGLAHELIAKAAELASLGPGCDELVLQVLTGLAAMLRDMKNQHWTDPEGAAALRDQIVGAVAHGYEVLVSDVHHATAATAIRDAMRGYELDAKLRTCERLLEMPTMRPDVGKGFLHSLIQDCSRRQSISPELQIRIAAISFVVDPISDSPVQGLQYPPQIQARRLLLQTSFPPQASPTRVGMAIAAATGLPDPIAELTARLALESPAERYRQFLRANEG